LEKFSHGFKRVASASASASSLIQLPSSISTYVKFLNQLTEPYN